MVNLDELRRRHAESKQAEDARNTLLEDLLQLVDDMQKQMDRNAFVMVLIDGDCMNFLNDLVKKGITGGDEAAKLLRRAVFDYLRYDPDFKHDQKIVIQVYANLRGLSKTYSDKGILPNTAAFAEFVLGFNKAHPLCVFIDAGNHKEAADTKLKEVFNLNFYNVHCKQIIFGASADNGYASFLSSFFVDADNSSRIRILKGPPFSFEFKSIISKFAWTEFKNVFRSDFIIQEPVQSNLWLRSQEVVQPRTQEPISSISNNTSTFAWRPKRNTELHAKSAIIDEHPIPLSSTNLIEFPGAKPLDVDQDSDGEGVDVPTELRSDRASASSAASSVHPGLWFPSRKPTTHEVAAALIQSTNKLLKESPKAVDFGFVKTKTEQLLGLKPDFWGKSEHDEWFLKSKNIIKLTIEDWIERTDNDPPKNATWILRFFSANESPSSVMKKPATIAWRPKTDLQLYKSVSQTLYQPRPTGRGSSGSSSSNSERDLDLHTTMLATIQPQTPTRYAAIDQSINPSASSRISYNALGQRIDIPTSYNISSALINSLRDRHPRLCNTHHLMRNCMNEHCAYDHNSTLNPHERAALLYLSRSQVCPQGSSCTLDMCIKGHMCPNGRNCKHGSGCRFADLHGIDMVVVGEAVGS